MANAAVRTRASARTLLRAFALAAAAAIATALVALVVPYLLLPVQGVVVEGARMLPQRAVWEAVPDHASLLTLDTSGIEREIESDPWVETAVVTGDRESGIVTVKVEERRAVLRGEIGGRTRYFAADGMELPGAGGARLKRLRLDEGRLREVLVVCEALNDGGVGLESVGSVSAAGIQTTVAGRRVILGGEVGDGQARALEDLARRHPEAPYFDLRSPERVIVGSREGSDGPAVRPGGWKG